MNHLARDISVREKVALESFLFLVVFNFGRHAHSRVHYTRRFQVKYMVQFRNAHEDSYYAAAIFRYQREIAVMFHEFIIFFYG